ncbi:hypothetical protein [uncultured Psychrosphaera sp.]|uniref:hypothetical protein n=1 Tax=uncultured Psychrosphaera sp. TaxID=1403522 RepID=UPI0026035D61|nr:hypothetical protein [uncultured Psychrosphaera sp.]
MSKKYLVTYKKRKMDLKGALSILELDEIEFQRGANLLAVGRLGKNTPVHLENIGITIVRLEDRDVKRLLANSEILAIEEDSEVRVQGGEPYKPVEVLLNNNRLNYINHQEANHVKTTPVPVWNVQKVKAPDTWALGIDGSGINFAIFGTGIAAHSDLIVAGGESFMTESIAEPETTPVYKDEHGHGTQCGIVAAGRHGYDGVAKNCNLYAVKVLNKEGKGRWSEVLAGMNWCIQNKMQVASIELGGETEPAFATATAIKNCQDCGLTVVIAADNKSGKAPSWLCFSANSLIVNTSSASSSDTKPMETVGQGNNTVAEILSKTIKNESHLADPVNDITDSTYLDNKYSIMSGDSMTTGPSCSHIAGLATLVYQKYLDIRGQMAEDKDYYNKEQMQKQPVS